MVRTAQLVLLSRVLSAIVQAVLLALLARHAAKSDFALVASLFAALTALMALTDPGLSHQALRSAARPVGRSAAREALAVHDCLQLLTGAVIVITGLVAAQTLGTSPWWGTFGLWYFFEKSSDARSTVSISLGRTREQVENLTIRRSVALGVYGLLFSRIAPVDAYVAAIASGALLGYLHIIVRQPSSELLRRPKISHLRASSGLWSASVATRVRNFEPTVAIQVLGAGVAAPFVAISRLSGPMRMLSSSLAAAVLPAVARNGSKTPEVSRILMGSLAAHLAIFGSLFTFAELFMVTALGKSYAGSGEVLRMYVPGLWASTGSALINAVLHGLHREVIVSRLAWGTSALALGGVAVGGSAWGPVGSAVGMTFAYLVQFTFLCYFYFRLP